MSTDPAALPAAPSTAARAASGILLLGIVAAGAWLRALCLDHAYDPDELSTLYHGATVLDMITDPETAVNPPLFRILFDVPFQETFGIWFGRRVSFVASVATIVLAYAAGLRASDSRVAALGAAALVAFHPGTVVMAARFRAYALWGVTLLGLAVAIDAWARRPDRLRTAWVVGLAFLLPQWNYLGAPLLLAMAAGGLAHPSTRGLWRLFVPAAVGLLPLLPWLLGGGDTRVPHTEALHTTLTRFMAFDVSLDRAAWNQVADLLPGAWRVLPPPHVGGYAAGVLLVLALFGRRPPLQRVLLAGTLGAYATIAVASQVQYVRSPVASILVLLAAPVLASVAAPVRPAAVRGALTLLALVAVGFSFPTTAHRTTETSVYRGLPEFIARVHAFDDVRGDAPVTTWPTWTFIGTHFYLTGTHIRAREGEVPPPCPLPCFAEQGIVWMTLPERGPHVAPNGLVAAFRKPPEGFAEGCELLDERRDVWVWMCRNRPEAPPMDPEGPGGP